MTKISETLIKIFGWTNQNIRSISQAFTNQRVYLSQSRIFLDHPKNGLKCFHLTYKDSQKSFISLALPEHIPIQPLNIEKFIKNALTMMP